MAGILVLPCHRENGRCVLWKIFYFVIFPPNNYTNQVHASLYDQGYGEQRSAEALTGRRQPYQAMQGVSI